jgi:hypothetical protein
MLLDLTRLASAPPESAVLRERLAATRRTAETCAGMIRNMALLLRPSMLDDLGLIPALRWQASDPGTGSRPRSGGWHIGVGAGQRASALTLVRRKVWGCSAWKNAWSVWAGNSSWSRKQDTAR